MKALVCSAIIVVACSVAFAAAQTATEPLSKTYRVTRADDVEFQKIEPFKVFDNLYYVGPGYVSVWLLTTPEGSILFDTAQEPYVDWVIGNIRKVGIDPKTIKYIILSHGHLDHVGGAAKLCLPRKESPFMISALRIKRFYGAAAVIAAALPKPNSRSRVLTRWRK
jgi:glyoxylase-like metal-dependent hydrolase (beta-lactamase superfamily II)